MKGSDKNAESFFLPLSQNVVAWASISEKKWKEDGRVSDLSPTSHYARQ